MRIALCDDDWVQLRILHGAVSGCKLWHDTELEADGFASGTELLKAVRSGKEYEYIFLDIEMPGLSGFFRCNRSTLVNLRHYSGRRENRLVIKHTERNIGISRRNLRKFDEQLIVYKMGDKNAF